MGFKKKQFSHIILIVDKQHIVGLDLMQTLREKGYKVTFKSDFKAAGEFVEKNNPDFIITETAALEEILAINQKANLVEIDNFSGLPHEENNMMILTKELEILVVFKKPFFTEKLASFLDNYLYN